MTKLTKVNSQSIFLNDMDALVSKNYFTIKSKNAKRKGSLKKFCKKKCKLKELAKAIFLVKVSTLKSL